MISAVESWTFSQGRVIYSYSAQRRKTSYVMKKRAVNRYCPFIQWGYRRIVNFCLFGFVSAEIENFTGSVIIAEKRGRMADK